MLTGTETRLTSAASLLLAAGFFVLALMSAISVTLNLKSRDDVALVNHTFEVQNALADLLGEIRRAETAYRGYLLVGDEASARGFAGSVARVPPALATVRSLVADSPSQERRLSDLSVLIERKIHDMNEGVVLLQASKHDEALEQFRTSAYRDVLPQIRSIIETMDAVEDNLLRQRQAESRRTNQLLFLSQIGCIALIVMLAAACIVVVRRSNRAREAAHNDLAAINNNLERLVSERTANLQAAHSESQRLSGMLGQTIASMPDAVLVTDENRKILIANPAAQSLFASEHPLGSAEWIEAFRRFRPDGTPLQPNETPLTRALKGDEVDDAEVILRSQGRKDLDIICNGRPFRDASGRVIGAVVIYRDVTEERETERQLRQSQKMEAVGQLTGGIAHDFNNILTVITGTIEILADAVRDQPTLAAVARMIDEAAERGSELTQRLLAFARKQPLQPRETDINAFIVDTAKLLRPTLGENIEIEAVLASEGAIAQVDPSQLTTAVLNLAINARDAMPQGGKLTLETRHVVLDESYAHTNQEVTPGSYVMIAVSDTGSGIPKAFRDKVFEPFFTTKEIGKGTGLGLSMVYGFLKQSGGHVKVYSEEGHGTTIRLYLPEAVGAPADAGMPTAPAERGGGETILVVEDDPLVLDYVSVQLRSLGYAVITARNAAEALSAVDRGENFDLLFTDVIMPGGMNGRVLAEEIERRRPGTKVLFTSGYTENAILHHGRLDPGVLLLPKPYRKSDLARMLRTALTREVAPA
jgi:signal transduction histidine kinase/CHASE3 domain sensor protein